MEAVAAFEGFGQLEVVAASVISGWMLHLWIGVAV
jgi:hypothetical protein